jgi:tol-pal system protein YbgF
MLALAAGCASRSSVHEIQGELSRVRAELAEVRLAQDLVSADLTRLLTEVRALEARTAETLERLRESAGEIGRLSARLSAAETEARQTRPAAPAPPAPRPTITIVHPPGVAPRPAPPAALPVPAEGDRPRDIGPDAPAQRAYAAALNTFRAREHGQAVLDFMDFIAKHPRHPLAVNAQYWIGEAYYVQRDYRHALVEFARVVDMAPRSAKAADALLKMGMCHVHLRDRAAAAETWQRVVRDHPRSEAAVKARAFLR